MILMVYEIYEFEMFVNKKNFRISRILTVESCDSRHTSLTFQCSHCCAKNQVTFQLFQVSSVTREDLAVEFSSDLSVI